MRICESVLLVEVMETTVLLHAMDEGVDEVEEIILSFTHEDADMAIGEWGTEQWGCKKDCGSGQCVQEIFHCD